ncbi:MAG: AAA family ATPase [Armatimonadetes bacterium]|nr:AAA family ATPase [Armatimonadota bacterium]
MGELSRENGGSARWAVTTLGSFKVQRGIAVATFRTKKTAGVFAHLAYYSGRAVPKDALVETFWPEGGSAQGRQSLRTALSSIRTSFDAEDLPGDLLFLSDHSTIELCPEHFTVDVREFREHLAIARRNETAQTDRVRHLAAACNLYSGTLLPGFTEEWILPQSLDLEEAFVQAVAELVVDLCSAGDSAGAIEFASRSLSICPSREEPHIALMRAYAAAKKPASVVAQFEKLEKMLDEEWGESPSDEAHEILDSLPRRPDRTHVAIGEISIDQEDAVSLAPAEKRIGQEAGTLFGRDEDIADIRQLLAPNDRSLLLTLTGLGGSGKTRLAQAVAQSLDQEFDGRVWFVSLVGTSAHNQVVDTLLSCVQPSLVPGPEPLGDLARILGDERALLVLDNLEHLLPSVARTIESISTMLPQVSILATSRMPTGAATETVWAVKPLPLPSDHRDIASLRANPCVQLLSERARAVRPGFEVSPINALGVFELCHRLEGVPLAVEIAASRMATKSPVQVLASFGRTVDLSTESQRVPERHRSLRSIVEWSVSVLDPECSRAFGSLSVCHGGWLEDLGRAILGADSDSLIAELVRSALVNWSENQDEVRFDMLETVREYAAEHLSGSPGERSDALARHAEFFAELAGDGSPRDEAWLKRMDAEKPNLLAVIKAASRGEVDPKRAWQVVEGVSVLVRSKGRYAMWAEPLTELIERTRDALDSREATLAHRAVGRVCYGMRDIGATYRHYLSAIGCADQTGDIALQARCRIDIAVPGSLLGNFDQAQQSVQKALEILREEGDPLAVSSAEVNLAWLYFDRGDEAESEPIFANSLAHAEASGDQSAIVSALVGLACAVGERDGDEAMRLFDRAEALLSDRNIPDQTAHTAYYRSLVEYRQGWTERAVESARRAMTTFVENGIALGQTPLTICGNVMAGAGRWQDAAVLWGRADASRKKYGMKIFPTLDKDFQREVARVKEALGPTAFAEAQAWGQQAPDDALVARVFGQAVVA